ncbi:MAG TPA: hypothetical protein VGB65_08260, partial [Allosphingosinicella sp.]
MMQVIFGDDEHTAADGPYSRLMKARKWIYIGSIAELAIIKGLYNETATAEILKVASVPVAVLQPALLVGLAYMLIQYNLLVWQLFTTYDIVLAERFTFRRSDELAVARQRVITSREAYQQSLQKAKTALESRPKEITQELFVKNFESYENAVKELEYARHAVEDAESNGAPPEVLRG